MLVKDRHDLWRKTHVWMIHLGVDWWQGQRKSVRVDKRMKLRRVSVMRCSSTRILLICRIMAHICGKLEGTDAHRAEADIDQASVVAIPHTPLEQIFEVLTTLGRVNMEGGPQTGAGQCDLSPVPTDLGSDDSVLDIEENVNQELDWQPRYRRRCRKRERRCPRPGAGPAVVLAATPNRRGLSKFSHSGLVARHGPLGGLIRSFGLIPLLLQTRGALFENV